MRAGERFGPGATAAVFGASGGIGEAFVHALAEDQGIARVFAFSRRGVPSAGKVTGLTCDPLDEASLASAAEVLREAGPLHLCVSAIGTLHGEGYGPEKAFRQLEADAFTQVLRINTLAPALVAKHCAPLLASDRPSALALLSARVGSISDNRLGGWHSYRASKAALNMLIRGLSIEVARRNDQAVVVGLHPGTVDTELSKPFQRGVPEGKLFTPAHSAEMMLSALAGLTPEDSGNVYDYAGERVPA
jgi:NAD(P)-dependent dehydrogenase (short-subunit alcohol dehydrogenase family)